MKYLSLVYVQRKKAAAAGPVCVAPRHLPRALLARIQRRSTLATDGPFVETKEYLGGI